VSSYRYNGGSTVTDNRTGLSSTSPVVDDTARKIAKFLKTCQFRFDNNWLTSGGSGTALDCYKDVLKLEPNNFDASRGLVNIENQYVKWAEKALKNGKKAKVRQYLASLRKVNPESPKLAVLKSQLESVNTQTTVVPIRRQSVISVRHESDFDLSVKPSFNCAKAKTVTEKTICGNRGLSNADARLGRIYSQLRHLLLKPKFRQLRKKQRAWLKQLNYCSGNVSCLLSTYERRIAELEKYSSGPSFSCAKAITRTEKAICSNSELSNADARLARIYSQRRQSLSKYDTKGLQKEQRAWLKMRNTCSDNISCLLQIYENRIVELENR
jgi:uncharacterized protein